MANKKIPLRQCVGCRAMKPKKELIRVLKIADDGNGAKAEFCLDTTGRKNGRGAYICPNRDCLAAAVKSKGLERSLKAPVPKEIYDMLAKEMERIENG